MDLVAGRVTADERRPIRHLDLTLLLVVGLITVAGFFLLYSATKTTLIGENQSQYARVVKQAVTAAIGLVVLLLLCTFDYRFLKVYAGFIYGGMLVMLVAVRLPFLGNSGIGWNAGAQRWFAFGGLQITPSEFVKVAIIVMLAAVLSEIRSPVPTLRDVLRVCVIAGIPLALVFLQPDIGTTIVLVVDPRWVAGGGGHASPASGGDRTRGGRGARAGVPARASSRPIR